jgi:hypothetical protein
MKHAYGSKVEEIQSRVDVVYFSQRTTGNCKIRVGLNVGCSIQCWNRQKKKGTADSKPVADLKSRKDGAMFVIK